MMMTHVVGRRTKWTDADAKPKDIVVEIKLALEPPIPHEFHLSSLQMKSSCSVASFETPHDSIKTSERAGILAGFLSSRPLSHSVQIGRCESAMRNAALLRRLSMYRVQYQASPAINLIKCMRRWLQESSSGTRPRRFWYLLAILLSFRQLLARCCCCTVSQFLEFEADCVIL